MRHVTIAILSILLVLCSASPATAQTSDLSIEQIMQEAETWVGAWPSSPFWSEDGETLYFQWNPNGAFISDSLFAVSRTGGEPEQVSPEDRRALRTFFSGWAHGTHRYTADFSRKVFTDGGDLFVMDRTSGETERLTHTRSSVNNARFSPDGAHVLYRQGGQLYKMTLATGTIQQLTDLRSGRGDQEDTPSEKEAWLEQQQQDLFDVLRERAEEREAREEQRDRDQAADDPPPTFHYGHGNLQQLQIDPTERFVTFTRVEPGDRERTQVMDYVTDDGYAEPLNARPKVDVPAHGVALFVQDLQRDTTFQVDLHQIEGAYDVPPFLQEQGVEKDSTEAKRDLSVYGPQWSGDGAHAVVVLRAHDNKDRWIARLDAETGDLTVLDRQHDEAWIAGPGIGWGSGTSGWLPDNEHFYFQSEATGYSHLYTVHVASGEIRQLTEGDFEIFSPEISQDGSTWYFLSSEGSPFERHVYSMPIAGGERTRLTAEAGMRTFALHPDEDQLATRFSTITKPWEIYLKNTGGEDRERVTHSPTEEWLAYPWREGELMWFEASDGIEVPAQLFVPEEPNGAAVHFVHGAGYLQNVHKGWSNYFREFMFHNMLTDLGYTVINVDFRASAGYGRDFRTAIYRHMGGRDLQDYVDASQYLEAEHGIDPQRQFIYGGSYGGFITLMALFTEADHFGGGAALRSVTDWAHYNHGYTSNILNTPVQDSMAYVRSSPIYHAEGLEDPLLMTHGLVDTNVQPQDIFRLSQRLIELGKTDWELATYPLEPHGFQTPSGWTDQYRRIFKYIEDSVGPERRR